MNILKIQQFNNITIILILSMVAFAVSGVTFIHHQFNNPIVGTWISVDDPNNKWVFSKEEMKSYYDGELFDTYTYRISTTSPQCGKEVQTGPKLEFLELTDVNDGEQQCYYINGLDNENLSLSPFGKSNIIVFEKQ